MMFQTFAVEAHAPLTAQLRRVMTFQEVLHATGYSRRSIYRLEASGRFPRRVKLGDGYGGKVGFWADEVATWLATRAAEAVVSGSAVPIVNRTRGSGL